MAEEEAATIDADVRQWQVRRIDIRSPVLKDAWPVARLELEHPVRGRYLTVGNPVKLSASPTTIGPSPLLGQHREEILRELGYGDDDIGALARDGAI